MRLDSTQLALRQRTSNMTRVWAGLVRLEALVGSAAQFHWLPDPGQRCLCIR